MEYYIKHGPHSLTETIRITTEFRILVKIVVVFDKRLLTFKCTLIYANAFKDFYLHNLHINPKEKAIKDKIPG